MALRNAFGIYSAKLKLPGLQSTLILLRMSCCVQPCWLVVGILTVCLWVCQQHLVDTRACPKKFMPLARQCCDRWLPCPWSAVARGSSRKSWNWWSNPWRMWTLKTSLSTSLKRRARLSRMVPAQVRAAANVYKDKGLFIRMNSLDAGKNHFALWDVKACGNLGMDHDGICWICLGAWFLNISVVSGIPNIGKDLYPTENAQIRSNV